MASFGGRSRFQVPRLAGSIVAATCGLLTFLACGPSVQSIHEGSVRFEHCYRLDLDLEIAPGHREACWKEWLSSYTYGQSADRIDYARRRVRAISSGDTSRPELDIAGERRPEERQFYLVVPGPTSMHAPPAPIATRVVGADAGIPPAPVVSSAPAETPPPPAPEDSCAKACRTTHTTCQASCDSDAGSSAACKSCDTEYKGCMRRCFR